MLVLPSEWEGGTAFQKEGAASVNALSEEGAAEARTQDVQGEGGGLVLKDCLRPSGYRGAPGRLMFEEAEEPTGIGHAL